MRNSQRIATASGDGGGEPTVDGAVAAEIGDTPTPKAKDPAALWPSTAETVRHVTV
jgi:hypothetical protein